MQKQVESFLPNTLSRSNGVVADREESFVRVEQSKVVSD